MRYAPAPDHNHFHPIPPYPMPPLGAEPVMFGRSLHTQPLIPRYLYTIIGSQNANKHDLSREWTQYMTSDVTFLMMLKHRCLDNVHAYNPSDVYSARVNREFQRRARSNGYSATVSAEGNHLMNERVSHHRVVPGVCRDVQTSASRSHTSVHTLWCVLKSDEQRVTETSSE